MTIQVQKFDGSIYVVVGQHAVFLTPEQAQELAAKLAKAEQWTLRSGHD